MYEALTVVKFKDSKYNSGYEGLGDVGNYCVAGSKFLLGMLKKILKIVVKVVQGYKRT